MDVSSKEVARLAALARLPLTEDEATRLAIELHGILQHVEALREVAVAAVEAIGGIAEAVAEPRADAPDGDRLLAPPASFAAEAQDGFFTVPRLAALDAAAVDEA